jgi:mono/diheme cytochrome c family protein
MLRHGLRMARTGLVRRFIELLVVRLCRSPAKFREKNFRVIAFAASAVLAERTAVAAEPGLTLFENYCAPCHGVDGKARTPAGRKLKAKDLAESKLGDEDVRRQIREGWKDPRGTEKMPPFKQKLTTDEIDAIIAYVKTFRPRGV